MDRVQNALDLVATFSALELEAFRRRLQDIKPKVSKLKAAKSPKKKPTCPGCGSSAVKGHGKYRDRRRYMCISCSKTFNDLTNTPLAGSHYPEKMQQFAAQMAGGGKSLRKSADALGVSKWTAFNWRHKVLRGYSVASSRRLHGIAEADETFFPYSEKGDKRVAMRRKAKKRGGIAKSRGVSDDHVPVIVACDRQGEVMLGVAGRGRISMKDVDQMLGNRIAPDTTLCTDSTADSKSRSQFTDITINSDDRLARVS